MGNLVLIIIIQLLLIFNYSINPGTKVFFNIETKKLNPVRVQNQVSEDLGRKDAKIISSKDLLIAQAKSDAEIAKLSQIKQLDGISAKPCVAAKPRYCESASKVTKNVGGKKEATSVVILSFSGKVPEKVRIGYLSFKLDLI